MLKMEAIVLSREDVVRWNERERNVNELYEE